MWLDHTSDDYEERCHQHLLRNRRILRDEMRAVIDCRTDGEKVALIQKWRSNYGPLLVRDLLSIARDKAARYLVAEWNVE